MLTSLQLVNFRNFERERFELSPTFNLFIGKNAQGKTNVIESLCLLATGHSFRTAEFRDMIRRECEAADVLATSRCDGGGDDLHVSIELSGKAFFRNEKKAAPGGFKGVRAVLFAPEEILLLRDSPSARRRSVDALIAEVVPAYRGLARRYERVVSHRNRFLQEAAGGRCIDAALLDGWNEQLVDLGTKIVLERARWCDRLNAHIPGRYATIAPEDGEARFCYRPHCGIASVAIGAGAIGQALEEGLSRRRADEIVRGITLVGPHRDDFEAAIGGQPIKHFGSQGQHRTFVLALKLAERELLREACGEVPLLLLDDVASELDVDRSRLFFEDLRGAPGQVFVTATDSDAIRLERAHPMRQFLIEAGRSMIGIW